MSQYGASPTDMRASDFNRRRGLKTAKPGASRIFSHSRTPFSQSFPRFPAKTPHFRDHGDLLVSRPSADQLIVVIMSLHAERHIGKAFLYAAKPLTEEDFGWDISGKPVVNIRSSRFILDQQLDSNWYKVRCG